MRKEEKKQGLLNAEAELRVSLALHGVFCGKEVHMENLSQKAQEDLENWEGIVQELLFKHYCEPEIQEPEIDEDLILDLGDGDVFCFEAVGELVQF